VIREKGKQAHDFATPMMGVVTVRKRGEAKDD